MKKPNNVVKHRFFVLLSCVALAALWYCFIVLFTLVLSRLELNFIDGNFALYSWFQLLFGPVMMGVASLLTLPFAVVIFKRLKVMRPKMSAIALSTALFFTFCLFGLTLDVYPLMMYRNPWYIPLVVAISMAISLTIYWVIIRKLAKKLSRLWLLVIIFGLPVAVFLADFFFRFSVTFL